MVSTCKNCISKNNRKINCKFYRLFIQYFTYIDKLNAYYSEHTYF